VDASTLTDRPLTEADFTEFHRVFASAFLREPTPEQDALERAMFEPGRFHGVFDGSELVGVGGIFTKRMTFPGPRVEPLGGVTTVGVAPGHRRRGVLTRLMRAQLHGLHERGAEPVLALWAAEASIYGRFGYGMAAQYAEVSVPRGVPFASTVDTGADRVRDLPRERALPLLFALHDRVRPTRVGWVTRSPAFWDFHLADHPDARRGQSALRFAVHPDGYAVYRVAENWTERGPRHVVRVRELVAATPVAYAALYRYLLDLDLVGEVVHALAAPDEPVVHLLADSRGALRHSSDSLWVRLVDLDRALVSRHYAAPLDVVLDVRDAVCPWNAGRWRLAVSDGVAQVARTDRPADLELDAAVLGAVFLGGTRLSTLAAAQRVRELTPGAVRAASRAFAGDQEPHCPEIF
jgi:predicted acetyltransferase